jgi:flagellar biosynthetic protein FliO
MRQYALTIIGLLLSCAAALPAPAQTTRPVLGDDFNEVVLPPRHGSTTQATTAGGSFAGTTSGDALDIKRLLLALGIVLAAIFISQKAWKKFGMPGVAGRSSGVLQVVSRLSVSPKQQILLVRVGRRFVVVGNSGTQMNTLCDISDPEEAALLLGQTATERQGSITSSFNAVLGEEEKHFEEETPPSLEAAEVPPDDPELASTREEINGLMEKVRGMSKQFRRA